MLNDTNFLKHHDFSLLTFLVEVINFHGVYYWTPELNVQVIDYANQTIKISYPPFPSIAFNM